MCNNKTIKIWLILSVFTHFHNLTGAKLHGLAQWLIMDHGNDIAADQELQFTDCGGKESLVHMKHLRAIPNTFKFPQNILLSAKLVVDEDIVGPIRSELILRRQFPYVGVIEIPCMRSFGSCDYSNICELLEAGKLTKDKVEVDTTNACTWVATFGLNCGCPLRKGVYNVENASLPIAGTLLPDWLESGTYDANFKILQRRRPIGCFQSSFTIQ